MRRYLVMVAVLSLAWEIAQLPLYTLWWQESPAAIAFAVAHCTAGDVIIATITLVLALLLLGDDAWPARRFGQVAAATIAFGVSYTVFSE
jgi:hypothetical protein